MNLVESLLHALKEHGARQIFGIPGDFALPTFASSSSRRYSRSTRCRMNPE